MGERRRRSATRRALTLVLGVAVLAGGAWFAAAFVAVRRAATTDERRGAQAIVVLGAAQYDGRPSPVLEARLERAVELFREEVAPVVVVTGGRQPGDRFTEATASANYLAAQGVPEGAILREVRGTSSYESLASTSSFLKKRRIKRVLLVSDAYHAARIVDIADEVGLEAAASPVQPVAETTTSRELAEAGAVAVGRVIGYRRLERFLGR